MLWNMLILLLMLFKIPTLIWAIVMLVHLAKGCRTWILSNFKPQGHGYCIFVVYFSTWHIFMQGHSGCFFFLKQNFTCRVDRKFLYVVVQLCATSSGRKTAPPLSGCAVVTCLIYHQYFLLSWTHYFHVNKALAGGTLAGYFPWFCSCELAALCAHQFAANSVSAVWRCYNGAFFRMLLQQG